jgi:hypothetical protein
VYLNNQKKQQKQESKETNTKSNKNNNKKHKKTTMETTSGRKVAGEKWPKHKETAATSDNEPRRSLR